MYNQSSCVSTLLNSGQPISDVTTNDVACNGGPNPTTNDGNSKLISYKSLCCFDGNPTFEGIF
jgi:hypothetical protein